MTRIFCEEFTLTGEINGAKALVVFGVRGKIISGVLYDPSELPELFIRKSYFGGKTLSMGETKDLLSEVGYESLMERASERYWEIILEGEVD